VSLGIGSRNGDPFAIVPRLDAATEEDAATKEEVPSIQRLVPEFSTPATWEMIAAYARDQAGEASLNRGPRRTVMVHERYQRYKAWCAERGHTGVELVVATAVWLQAIKAEMAGSEGVRVALEPNVVPYHIEPHIEHWVLWYHPESTSGKADLCADQFVPHLRRFLPSLRAEEEVLCFQNLPQFRRVPE